MLQFLRTGSRAALPTQQLTRGLLGNQRVLGTAGFIAGFRRVGTRHKELVEVFLGALGRGKYSAARHTLLSTAPMTLGDNDAFDLAELAERLRGAGTSKIISAGH
ncbi:MAG TPA: hypothetical protein VME67_25365 [Mycobacterium sp.]|nr:hypothetical protein [Mycobacterium sp.]HTX97872.1 hypothetical protein [Mycobacterium sp.]